MLLSSIRSRLTLAIMLGSTALMILLSISMMWFMRWVAERDAEKILTAASRKIQAELNNGEQHYAISEVISENSDMLKVDDLAMLIVDAKGRVIQKSQSIVPIWPGGKNNEWRVASLPTATHTIVIGFPWRNIENGLRNQALILLSVSLSVILCSTVGAWWLVGRTLLPISSLAQQAQNVSAENLNLHLVPSSQDTEVVQLVATLNSLLKRISLTAAAKGRFHAAASHELRTPLQILSGHLEVALSQERTGPEYRQAMEEANRQTQHLTSLTRDLLLLNQLDTAACPPGEPIDISDICQRTLSHFQPLMAQRNLNLQASLSAELIKIFSSSRFIALTPRVTPKPAATVWGWQFVRRLRL